MSAERTLQTNPTNTKPANYIGGFLLVCETDPRPTTDFPKTKNFIKIF